MYTSQVTFSFENIHFHSEYSLRQTLEIKYYTLFIFACFPIGIQIVRYLAALLPKMWVVFFFLTYPHEIGETSCLSTFNTEDKITK